METVRTSEVLESQILEDARAKAKRILGAADKECETVRAEWARRDAEEVRRLDAVQEARMAGMRHDLEASLPLDFMRARLSFFQKAVSAALEGLFKALDGQEMGRVIGGQIARASFAFAGQELVVWRAGLSEEEARRIVTAGVPEAAVREVRQLPPEQAAETGTGIVVETADGSRKFRATLQELSALLLEEYREELLTALFGKEARK